MRAGLVVTNLRCNQACTYCQRRAPRDDLARIQAPVLVAAMADALAGGAEELVLSGGEPTLRGDLGALVAEAKRRGAARVILETNATLVDGERARALAEAGLDVARVNLSGWGDALDAVTRDPGGFRRTLAGMAALRDAGVRLVVRAALIAPTRPLFPALPAGIVDALGDGAVELVSVVVPHEGPDPALLLPYDVAAGAIVELEAAARRVGLAVQVAPHSGPPPCVLPATNRHAGLYALTRGGLRSDGHTRVEACGACLVADRCSGFPTPALARHGVPPHQPITEPRLRRRLSVISSVREQVERELVQIDRYPEGTRPAVEAIRVQFHCNQACHFCFVSTHLPGVGEARVREAITQAGARGSQIVLSGGEPTLHPKLPELVRLAKQVSRHAVELQTNAVRLADPALVRALVEAGLDRAWVSLHGATAEVCDAVTDAPGTFERTVVGLDHLHAAPLAVSVNFVACRLNFHQLPDVVALVGTRWPRAQLVVSFVAPSTDVVPRAASLVPRYSELAPALAAAAAEAERRDMRLTGFGKTCGIPRCLVPRSPAFPEDEGIVPLPDEGVEFAKPAPCARCSESPRCLGVRTSYLELYGDGELRPIEAPTT